MIKVNRARVAIPEDLRTDVDSEGKLEIEEAKIFFEKKVLARQAAENTQAKVERNQESFKFKAYKKAKTALQKLFHNKCGYCEIGYGGAASDVEHFRPKGEIDYLSQGRVLTHPEGYYWLAADWENLIYSCQHCNRGENHDHQERAGAPLVRRVSGKANHFPLSDESKRLKACDPVDAEEPYRLLLNPCRDVPSDHLMFRSDGFVTPKIIEGRPSPQGTASILLYGLKRVELIRCRKDAATKLLFNLERLNDALAQQKASPSEVHRSTVLDTMRHIRAEYLVPDKPFLAMAWTLFRQRVNVAEIYAVTRVVPEPQAGEELEPSALR